MATQPFLELHLHFVNGNTHKFVQNDPQLAQQVLQQINFKIFTEPSLVIFGQNQVVTYPGSALVGISLIVETVPEELLHLMPNPAVGLEDTREITEHDYQAKQREMQPIVEGQPFVLVQQVELTTGHRFWLEHHVRAAVSKMQERHILHNVFSQPAIMYNRLDGGISIWHRAKIVSASFCPKPEVPTNAWPAESVAT